LFCSSNRDRIRSHICRPNDYSSQTAASGLPNFHQVDPYLYRGAAPTPAGIQALKKLGIKTIIDFRVNPEMVQAERNIALSFGIHYINFLFTIAT